LKQLSCGALGFWQAEHKLFAASSDAEGKPSLAGTDFIMAGYVARTGSIVSNHPTKARGRWYEHCQNVQQACTEGHSCCYA